jgi:hypothetical protein
MSAPVLLTPRRLSPLRVAAAALLVLLAGALLFVTCFGVWATYGLAHFYGQAVGVWPLVTAAAMSAWISAWGAVRLLRIGMPRWAAPVALIVVLALSAGGAGMANWLGGRPKRAQAAVVAAACSARDREMLRGTGIAGWTIETVQGDDAGRCDLRFSMPGGDADLMREADRALSRQGWRRVGPAGTDDRQATYRRDGQTLVVAVIVYPAEPSKGEQGWLLLS